MAGALTKVTLARAERVLVDVIVRWHPSILQDILHRIAGSAYDVPPREPLAPASKAFRMQAGAAVAATQYLNSCAADPSRQKPYEPGFHLDLGYGTGPSEYNVLLWNLIDRQILESLAEYHHQIAEVEKTVHSLEAYYRSLADFAGDADSAYVLHDYVLATRYPGILRTMYGEPEEG